MERKLMAELSFTWTEIPPIADFYSVKIGEKEIGEIDQSGPHWQWVFTHTIGNPLTNSKLTSQALGEIKSFLDDLNAQGDAWCQPTISK
jgi:hypothetical protein